MELETHELYISDDEIEMHNMKHNRGFYIMQEAVKKANRLGNEKMKIQRIESESAIGGWIIRFFCEKDIFWS